MAVNAYLPRNEKTSAALTKLRTALRKKTGCATTVGFGPRYLHSTGQLHKGGPNTGLFLLLTVSTGKDVNIPTEAMTYGTLQQAQVIGEREALKARRRRVLRIHLEKPADVRLLMDALK